MCPVHDPDAYMACARRYFPLEAEKSVADVWDRM